MPLLNLTPDQEQLLLQLRNDYIAQLASFRFNDPAHDNMLIRQHAAVYGKVEVLTQLLELDTRSAEEQQRSLDDLVNSQLG